MNKKNLGFLGAIILVILIGLFASGTLGRSGDDQLAAGRGSGSGGSGGGGETYYCSDSDGGVNTTVKGTVEKYKLKNNGQHTGSTFYVDSCSGATSVTEYSCNASANDVVTTNNPCGTGNSCVDGACVASGGGGGGDTTPPTASMITADGATYTCGSGTGSICINNVYPGAVSMDNVGTQSVTFYNNGATFTSGTYSTTDPQGNPVYSDEFFRGNNLALGSYNYTITAQSTDTSGNVSAMSSPINVTIEIAEICSGTSSIFCQASGGGKGN